MAAGKHLSPGHMRHSGSRSTDSSSAAKPGCFPLSNLRTYSLFSRACMAPPNMFRDPDAGQERCYLLGTVRTSAKRGAPSSHATRAPLAVKLMA